METPSTAKTAAVATAIKPDIPVTVTVPDSQESAVSTTFSAPALASSSSNLSTSTTTETDSTAPSSANVPTQSKQHEVSMPPTPCSQPLGSPAPVTQSSKRTSDGSLKRPGVGGEGESRPGRISAHKRNKSMDTHSAIPGTRIGELSAQLKTRLSYAMVKVQNGWEKQSLEELEEGQSQRASPNSAPGRSDHVPFESPATSNRRRRPSHVSDSSDQMLMSPSSDPSASVPARPVSYWGPGTHPALNAAANLIDITGGHHPYGLAPAPTFQTSRRRRSTLTHAPPLLLGAGTQRKHHSHLGAHPSSPQTPRGTGILRMPSQQAEKDAVDTLLFMSSPNNSQRLPTSAQTMPMPSPLRAEAPQRRVMFETYPSQEKRGVVYQPGMPAPPHHHQHAPYPAYPAR
ncbi:Whi5 domain-containing protein [Pyrenophora tritici-repentis]|uniref:Whi5 domain containing protein n=1 Tax=Pyrenophora tritici-repentis TaxID=45151 RepID=A0A834RU28_9PLEO|nr:Whi5 domain containing protein [Pyrenophora tritici-repentis]KAF7569899.1 hypothetical protein PtrM4_123140 [Pyrenophora tritici-repentis]KAI0574001.1 Whi5 domain-containing protein [Pyrenophora tritici-repentis]KAI0577208.1 Whi5 domain-containing protein [Pyrenophora tritici-repentis]KAI0607293.1 Whi5 domain-containing protein [Pyrenophora tritici-repentis]